VFHVKTITVAHPKVKPVGKRGKKYVYNVGKSKKCFVITKGTLHANGTVTFKEVSCPEKPTIFVLQGNYGYGDGWEDLTAEETKAEILKRLKEYRENEGGNYRIRRTQDY
jgi:hypothetical protein